MRKRLTPAEMKYIIYRVVKNGYESIDDEKKTPANSTRGANWLITKFSTRFTISLTSTNKTRKISVIPSTGTSHSFRQEVTAIEI